MKLYYLTDHQNKSARYAEALRAAGWTAARNMMVQGTRFYLTDADWRRQEGEEARKRALPTFLYPHAARPMVQYDCPGLDPQPVTAMFTQAEGGRELMRRIGYPYPVEVTGWALSEVRPFTPAERVRRVTFAPIHPNQNGFLSELDKDLNRRTLARLLEWCRSNGARMTIRYIGTPEQNGLEDFYRYMDSFTEVWKQGRKNGSIDDILNADLVAGHQTFAWMAVALGKPTVMMGEDLPPRTGNTAESLSFAAHWEDYRDYLRFPLDILDGETDAIIADACAGTGEVEAWKARFIGNPFDGERFARTLEGYL